MDTTRAGLLVVGVLVGLALAAVLVGVSQFDGSGGGLQEAELADFETNGPYCGDPNGTSGSSLTTSRSGPGATFVVNSTIPVAGPDSEVDASVDTWGQRRHTLKLNREPATRDERCPYEVRFFATVDLPSDDWTLLVTYEDVLVGGHYGDESGGGSFGSSPHPLPPTPTDAPTRTTDSATATDAAGAA